MNRTDKTFNLLKRSVLVVFLNQTKEELCLDTDSHQLAQGTWAASNKLPPSILAGESGLWRSKSSKSGRGTMGSVAYHIAGDPLQHVVKASWKNPVLGRNSYQGSVTTSEFDLDIHGSGGAHGIVVFILRMSIRYTVCRPELIVDDG
ncbi:hypothetical protein DM02DRAFT_620536 [Periconia macrospinosa]|uniref:Uncharacterized protein n=1 Tax=Periconia macrospinosa TaxID=97972 RepID=A0A2V1D071_9PLEO|nr:hypothetical protein DM02DRAFT_620536 [Periconia macrospinosa]